MTTALRTASPIRIAHSEPTRRRRTAAQIAADSSSGSRASPKPDAAAWAARSEVDHVHCPYAMTTLIQYRGEVVAVAGASRFHLAPHIEAREPGDPLRAVVTLMCVFAERVHAGELPGP